MKSVSFLAGLTVLAGVVEAYQGCDVCTNNSTDPLVEVSAPWTLSGTVYSLPIIPLSTDLPVKAYPPLERGSQVQTNGTFKGILGMIQIIRYADSPVGPYDELLIVPGYYSYERDGGEQTRVRISRIYVSQKYTCYNGRVNWNISKHLADFDWTSNHDGSTTVKVYPYDTTGDPAERTPAAKPWFQTTFAPLLGTVPFSTDAYAYLGINATLAQPPLPSGNHAAEWGQLPGTESGTWAATVPGEASDRTWLGVFDMAQPGGGDAFAENGTNAVGDEYFENFWPGLGRWNVGLRQDDATITFSAPEVWS